MTAWKKQLLTAFKAALGAAASIVLAGLLGLSSPMTAGIIAVLSIQGTKRATWRVAGERVLAFLCANAIGWLCFSLLGYSLAGFTAYLFAYAMVCVGCGWMHALAPISVLVTHYVLAGDMAWPMIGNEALLLLVGAGVGMAVNLHLHPRVREMDRLAGEMDAAMIAALHALANEPESDAPFIVLDKALDRAEHLAAENRDNTLDGSDGGDAAYVALRRSQRNVLAEMRDDLRGLTGRPAQLDEVRGLLHAVADGYRRDNNVEDLLRRLQDVLGGMKQQALPATRAEFEDRAVLYHVLLRLHDFLKLKNVYQRGVDARRKG